MPWLSFRDLVSALFIRAFRDHGVSLQHVRRMALKAAREYGNDRPFTLGIFTTDGRKIFEWIGDEPEARKLADFEHGQLVIRSVVEPLLREIQYASDGTAERWWPLGPEKSVVVDPGVAMGEPNVRGIPTRVLYGPVMAGDDAAMVARWYGLTEAEVLAAVDYERNTHARAA